MIGNDNGDELVRMSANSDERDLVKIPSVFVSDLSRSIINQTMQEQPLIAILNSQGEGMTEFISRGG